MRQTDVNCGGVYLAKVSSQLRPVLVVKIRPGSRSRVGYTKTSYDCINLDTGRAILVRSAQRLRAILMPAKVTCQRDGTTWTATVEPYPNHPEGSTTFIECPTCGRRYFRGEDDSRYVADRPLAVLTWRRI